MIVFLLITFLTKAQKSAGDIGNYVPTWIGNSLQLGDNSHPDHYYRSSTFGSGYNQLNSSLLTSPDYVDNDVSIGNTYCFVVTAVDNGDHELDYSSEAEIAVVTSVQDLSGDSGLEIRPNPLGEGVLTIDFGNMYDDAKVVVRDLKGVVIYQDKVTGYTSTISADEFPGGGVYIISVVSKGLVVNGVLIVR